MPTVETIPAGSSLLHLAFACLTLFLPTLFVVAVYSSSVRTGLATGVARRRAIVAAIGSIVWIGLTWMLARRGALSFASPPTMMVLLVATLVVAIVVVRSDLGRRLATGISLTALVGFQSFRILVELTLHRAYVEGLMPVQMSYSGRNFDIVTGLTAIAVAFWLATGERRNWRSVVRIWNALGIVLLLNILGIALLSAPTPFRKFMNEPSNVWVTQEPWVWLPTVMVLAAIICHMLVFRRLRDHT